MNPFSFRAKNDFKISRKFLTEKDWEGREEFAGEADLRPAELRFEFKRFRLFKAFALICFLILAWRLFSLQILARDLYRREAEGNRIRTFGLSASRGVIYDRAGNLLVRNIPSFEVVFIPNDLPRAPEERGKLIASLAGILNLETSFIEIRFREANQYSYEPETLVRNLEREKALVLDTKLDVLPGINLFKNSMREYIGGDSVAHILGYTGKISAEEYKEKKNNGYFLTDLIGKQGVEYFYEKALRGSSGKEIVEVDSQGKIKKILEIDAPEPGENLKLSLDLELEKKIVAEMNLAMEKTGSRRGAAVAVDPRNGQILALVSIPTYDNNLFAAGISGEDFEDLNNDPGKPLFNRVIGGEYPPGSTIKPFIAVAALEEKVISANRSLNCPGSLVYAGWAGTIWHFPDWKAHGPTDVRKAIAESCDVFFYVLGGGSPNYNVEGLGIERIKAWAQLFNLGIASGIDLPGEATGLIPSPAWKEKVKGETWYIGDTYHASIGQGDILTTPLQITNVTATIANGGTLYKPKIGYQLVDSTTGQERGLEAEILRKDFMHQENIEVVRQGMRDAVLYGSARALGSLPVPAAGKTGTAQFGNMDQTHAWFTSFAPYHTPEIALTILIEAGGDGDKVAVPIAKNVLEWYFARKQE